MKKKKKHKIKENFLFFLHKHLLSIPAVNVYQLVSQSFAGEGFFNTHQRHDLIDGSNPTLVLFLWRVKQSAVHVLVRDSELIGHPPCKMISLLWFVAVWFSMRGPQGVIGIHLVRMPVDENCDKMVRVPHPTRILPTRGKFFQWKLLIVQ